MFVNPVLRFTFQLIYIETQMVRYRSNLKSLTKILCVQDARTCRNQHNNCILHLHQNDMGCEHFMRIHALETIIKSF